MSAAKLAPCPRRGGKAVMNGAIFFSERNIHGAWVVYGTEGVKQYYGYTKAESEALYRESYREVYAKK